jgi:hypothetical protein
LFAKASEWHELRDGFTSRRIIGETGAWIVDFDIDIVRRDDIVLDA